MGRGMPRPYNFFVPISECNLFCAIIYFSFGSQLLYGRGMPRPVSKCNLFGSVVTSAMGRGMPRPYNFFVTVSECNLFRVVIYFCYGSRHAATVQLLRSH